VKARNTSAPSRVISSSAVALITFLAGARLAMGETPLDRGDYLVNAVMACDGCHTPRGPDGNFVMEKRFSGGSQTWDEPAFLVKGSNITPDPTTGIGTWNADELKRTLTEGVRPDHVPFNGVPLAPQMPFPFYKILTPRDLDAVVTYVRSVRPVRNEVQPPVYKTPMHVELIPGPRSRSTMRRCAIRSSADFISLPSPIAWNVMPAVPTGLTTSPIGSARVAMK